jgi:hypothetical protein
LERFTYNFILETYMLIFPRNVNFDKIEQKPGALYIKTEVGFDGSGDTKSV